jgi:ABC-type ATPase with predicted acetyltransferase domain
MKLTVAYDFLPKQRTLGTSMVMDHFGIDFDQGRHVVADQVDLPIAPGQIVLFVGPSGSGKSSLLRAAARQLKPILWIDQLSWPEVPLVDALPGDLQANLALLAACGLGEAQLLLRTPGELSEGQRYRFRLALGWALACQKTQHENATPWLAADEFSATLDRTLAKVVSYNLRRLCRRHRSIGVLLATTHEDIVDDVQPDVLVRCDLDGKVEVSRGAVTERPISFFVNAGAARAPSPTGRTSLGGIIAATTWPW